MSGAAVLTDQVFASTGDLADRIDATVLARYAEAVRPEPRPLADEASRALSALVGRRRQLLAMITAEGNRLARAPKPLRKGLKAHLRWLRKEVERTEAEVDRIVQEFGSKAVNQQSTTYRSFNDFLKASDPEAQIMAPSTCG